MVANKGIVNGVGRFLYGDWVQPLGDGVKKAAKGTEGGLFNWSIWKNQYAEACKNLDLAAQVETQYGPRINEAMDNALKNLPPNATKQDRIRAVATEGHKIVVDAKKANTTGQEAKELKKFVTKTAKSKVSKGFWSKLANSTFGKMAGKVLKRLGPIAIAISAVQSAFEGYKIDGWAGAIKEAVRGAVKMAAFAVIGAIAAATLPVSGIVATLVVPLIATTLITDPLTDKVFGKTPEEKQELAQQEAEKQMMPEQQFYNPFEFSQPNNAQRSLGSFGSASNMSLADFNKTLDEITLPAVTAMENRYNCYGLC